MNINPFIPLPGKMGNTVVVDGRVSTEILNNLKKMNLKIIPTIECIGVDMPISYHPDIVMHPINHNTIIVAPNVFDYYREKFYGMGIKILEGQTKLKENYPGDIAYNVGRVGNIAIHNFKYTDEKLKFYLLKENIKLIHINQGYTKCSMGIVDEKAVITSDYPMYQKLTNLGIDVLLIKSGNIKIDKYDYGFIGGTWGNLSRDIIMISGVLNEHPDRENIIKFFKKYKKRIVWLSNEKIIDIGTIISLYCQ